MLTAAMTALKPAETRLIPVGNAWQKGRAPLASATARVAMLEAAMDSHKVKIDQRELLRQGLTYSVDTLTELTRENPDAEFIWLIGSDAFSRLDTWHRAADLVALATFLVVARSGEAITAPVLACRFQRLPCTPPPVSSTAIRARVKAGASIRGLVPAAVCDYIEQHNLYQ